MTALTRLHLDIGHIDDKMYLWNAGPAVSYSHPPYPEKHSQTLHGPNAGPLHLEKVAQGQHDQPDINKHEQDHVAQHEAVARNWAETMFSHLPSLEQFGIPLLLNSDVHYWMMYENEWRQRSIEKTELDGGRVKVRLEDDCLHKYP